MGGSPLFLSAELTEIAKAVLVRFGYHEELGAERVDDTAPIALSMCGCVDRFVVSAVQSNVFAVGSEKLKILDRDNWW